MYASFRAAINYFAELRPSDHRPSILELLNLAEANDPDAIAALSRQASYLGKGLGMLVAALAPEVIILIGGLTASWTRFGPTVEAALAETMLGIDPPRIAVAADVELARLRGAAVLVLQRHSGYHRSNREMLNGKSIRKRRDRKPALARA
jgi:predicted NBD/HSP70 family sugar kinase